MLTLIFIFVLLPMLLFLGLSIQEWLFGALADQHDPEWELYRQRYD
ncbi:MAG TPA: hypothetical protein VGD98_12355 [Ktedonobacteraceae bacterium]